MDSNQKDEQLSKQLDICKKLFSESKYAECLKVLTKLKDASSWGPAITAKLQCNSLVVELHKNKFVASSLDNLDRVIKTVSQSFNAGVVKDMNGSELILLYNISLVCFYLQKYDTCIMFLDKLFNGKMADGSMPVGPTRLDLMNCDFDLKYNVALLWCEACIRSIDKAENSHTVLAWLETKLASEKATCKETKLLIDKLWNRVHLIKTNLYLLNGNMKACKKDIRSLSSTFNHGVPAAFIKSNYEYVRKSFIKSMKVLQIQQYRPFTETGECIPMMYYNNLGCLHYRMGKPALGIHYSKRAFSELEKMQASKSNKKENKNNSHNVANSCSLYSASALRSFELHYNLGMQLLAADMPDQAFESFFNAVQLYYCNPKLWFRLAQCCIAKYRKTERDNNEADDIHFESVGQGIHHKLVLTSRSVKSHLFSDESQCAGRGGADIQSAAFPAASLGFGALCIENALMLITKYQGNAASSKPFAPMKETALKHLRSHALASGAYINLGLENYMKALRYCNMGLNDEAVLGCIKYSLTMYQAEALMNLGRISSAITNLKSLQVDELDLKISPYETSSSGNGSTDKNSQDPSSDLLDSGGDASSVHSSSTGNISENQNKLYPSSSLLASSYQYINLASAYSVEKNFEVSRQYLNSAASTLGRNRSKLPVECVMLAAYIEFCHNHESLGIEILQRRQIPNYSSLNTSVK